jgi:RNA polymerase sigma-70 factor, ECF subfamily
MGSASAFEYPDEAKLEHYRSQLRGYVVRQGLAAEADDIVSEAITRFLEHRDSLDLNTDPMRWLWCVTRNLCTDARRLRSRVEAPGPAEIEHLVRDVAPSALEDLLDQSLPEPLVTAVRSLPERQRTMFLERHWFGYDYEEMSARHGASTNSLRQIVHRARRQLVAMLEDIRMLNILIVLRLRIRRIVSIGESPALLVTAMAQAVVPLAILAGVVANGLSSAGVEGKTTNPVVHVAHDRVVVREVKQVTKVVGSREPTTRHSNGTEVYDQTEQVVPKVQPTVAAKPSDPCQNERGRYDVYVNINGEDYGTSIEPHRVPENPVVKQACTDQTNLSGPKPD